MRKFATISTLLACLPAAMSALAQVDLRPPIEEWAVKLGERVAATEDAFPIIDRVVLVPDEATYLDELAKWSPEGRWPVLFEDQRLNGMFIRAFAPAEVIRRESVGRLPRDDAQQRRLVEAVLVKAWGGDPANDHMSVAFERAGHTPAGVVLTSVSDHAWPAGLALAAGRGQPLLWFEGDTAGPNEAANEDEAARLALASIAAIEQTGYPFIELGDAIDAITICREIPGKVSVSAAPAAGGAGGAAGRRPGAAGEDFRAMTDVFGRHPQTGERFAFAGWIFGSRTQATYAAMCSLFLERDEIRLVNTYPLAEAGWSQYAVTDAGTRLGDAGYKVDVAEGEAATDVSWLRGLAGGMKADVLLMNTKGNQAFFDLFGGGRLYAQDVPLLNTPLAVHFVHSWSFAQPAARGTVGGTWLDHGAYAYVGSVQEPGLAAFLPPITIAERLQRGVPFIVAARHWRAPTWKVNTYGDPLMLVRAGANRERLAQPAGYGENLRKTLEDALAAASDKTESVAQVFELCNLLGADAEAIGIWQKVKDQKPSMKAAEAILPILFRHRRAGDFMEAWHEGGMNAENAADMLWHLMPTHLGGRADDDTLLILQANMRRPMTHADLARIAPLLRAAFGEAYVRQVIERELAGTKNRLNERELRKLLRGLN